MEIFRSLGINPNTYIQAFENKISPFLRENGMVDGKFLARTLKVWKPRLAQYLAIPEGDFRLVDMVDSVIDLIGIGGVK